LDEVLAVGDESFQRKCLDIFENYKTTKQTIVLVTHEMETVKRFCNRALLINDGNLIDQGDPQRIADEYSRLNQDQSDKQAPAIKHDNTSDLKINLRDASGKEAKRFNYGDTLKIDLKWPKGKQVKNAGAAIYAPLGECVYATNTFIDKKEIKGNSISLSLELKLGSGKYYIIAGTFLDRPEQKVDFVTHGPELVINNEKAIGGEGITRLKHNWEQVK
jgi:ABC-type multidrug transport system ATPase subunit